MKPDELRALADALDSGTHYVESPELHETMMRAADYLRAQADAQPERQPASEPRPCTCHPDDNPPVPCAQKYALNECRATRSGPTEAQIEAAIKRITHGEGEMRVPVEATDPDIVLRDCQQEIDRLTRERDEARAERDAMRAALTFYAKQEHFILSDDNAWDTVSGEPPNYWCDEAGTATVEDGSIARLVLAGELVDLEDDAQAEDAARYRLVRRGQHWSVINGIGDQLRADALDAAIDAQIEQERSEQAKERA